MCARARPLSLLFALPPLLVPSFDLLTGGGTRGMHHPLHPRDREPPPPLHIDCARVNKQTNKQVTANKYQKKSRNKMCCFLVIIMIVLAIVVVIIVISSSKGKPDDTTTIATTTSSN